MLNPNEKAFKVIRFFPPPIHPLCARHCEQTISSEKVRERWGDSETIAAKATEVWAKMAGSSS